MDINALLEQAGIDRKSVDGLTPTLTPLYVRRRFAAATYAAGSQIEVFNEGIGNEATSYGYASGKLTSLHTNMDKGGKVFKGELFLCTGLSITPPDNMPIAEWRTVQANTLAWQEGGRASESLQLGRVATVPPVYGPDYEVTTTADTPLQVRAHGPKMLFDHLLFVIEGDEALHDQGKLVQTFHESYVAAADRIVDYYLHGVWFQRVASMASRRIEKSKARIRA